MEAVEFRLGIGGPSHRMERAIHLTKPSRVVFAAIAVTWVPLVVLSAAEQVLTGRAEPLLRDLSVHARLLVTVPVLLAADIWLDRGCRRTVRRLFADGFLVGETDARARALLRGVERWRDSPAPETLLFLVALLFGAASLTGILPPAGLMHGLEGARHGAVRTWYALVSLPLFQFVLWRSLFRWGLWVRVLVGISRLPLHLLPMHADRRGGIGFLSRPSLGYCALLLFAVSCALCGGWASQIRLEATTVDTFKPLLIAFVMIGAVVAFLPLLSFTPLLFRTKRAGRDLYGSLVTDYVRDFDARWLEARTRPELLGTSDLQSLADISTSYRENVESMQLLMFDARDAVFLLVMAQLPAVPILLWQTPTDQVVGSLLGLITGGIGGR
jgi:hypothetical protein